MTSQVPPTLDVAAAWSWRLLVIAAAAAASIMAASRLRLVLLPMGVAILLATVLVPPTQWLVRRRLRPLLATWSSFLGLLALVVAVGMAVVPPLVDEFGELGPTLTDAADELEDWLVDGPLGLDPSTVADGRERLARSAAGLFSADGALIDGAVLAAEVVTGVLLSMVIAFFLVKDGERIQRWALDQVPDHRRLVVRRMAVAAWSSLGRYVAGAATLGVVEAVAIGLTLAATGSAVVAPVAALTFVAAFVPFVGAMVAGVIAVLVALVSSGPPAAAIVAVVALVVQQFDNELLAPFVYSRVLRLHPLVVILAVATGAAVGGVIGAFVAVPLVAVAVSASAAARDQVPADTS